MKIVNLTASQNSKLLLLHHFAAQFGHKEHSANVHRGAYALAERATEAQYATSRSLSRMRLFLAVKKSLYIFLDFRTCPKWRIRSNKFEIETEAFEHARSSVAELIGAKSPQEFLGSLEKIRKDANMLQNIIYIFFTRCYSMTWLLEDLHLFASFQHGRDRGSSSPLVPPMPSTWWRRAGVPPIWHPTMKCWSRLLDDVCVVHWAHVFFFDIIFILLYLKSLPGSFLNGEILSEFIWILHNSSRRGHGTSLQHRALAVSLLHWRDGNLDVLKHEAYQFKGWQHKELERNWSGLASLTRWGGLEGNTCEYPSILLY